MPVTVFVVPRDLPLSGGARTASPTRLHMLAGGQSGSDGKCLSRLSAGRSGKAVPVTSGFCRTRGPSAKRGGSYGLAPPACICSRGGGSPGQTASVCLPIQLEAASTHRVKLRRQASGKAEPVTVVVAPGDLPPSGGARTASPPACICLRGGSPGHLPANQLLSESNVTAVGSSPRPCGLAP